MQRYMLGIEYDGSRYCGWQRQKHCDSVQDNVERALGRVLDHDVEIQCAGRTDAGVHACDQVVHFDTGAKRSRSGLVLGVNSYLPKDISIHWAATVASDFHARFSALERRYRYLILNARARSALFAKRAWVVHEPLDATLMQQGASALLGEHDFSAFRAAGCQAKHARRTITALRVSRLQQWVIIDIAANAFLQNMVRNVTGLLVAIGSSARPVSDTAEVLASKDRKTGGVTAPPQGLYLTRVVYPQDSGVVSTELVDRQLPDRLPLLPISTPME